MGMLDDYQRNLESLRKEDMLELERKRQEARRKLNHATADVMDKLAAHKAMTNLFNPDAAAAGEALADAHALNIRAMVLRATGIDPNL